MDKRLVIDIETKKTFDEVGGRDHLDQLGVTIVGVYDYSRNQYQVYEEKDLGQFQNVLIDASLIIGFNLVGFDLPVLQPYLTIDINNLPVFDIMLDFQKKLGHRIGLDSLAKATLGIGKTGHGLDAIRFYREGRMQELKDYCLNDVKVTKDIFDYGIENRKIYYLSKLGEERKELVVDWSDYREPDCSSSSNPPAQYKLF